MIRSTLAVCAGVCLLAPALSAQGPRAPDKTPVILGAPATDTLFRIRQLQNPRVITALIETKFAMLNEFRKKGIPYPVTGILLRTFKREHELELWVQPRAGEKYVLMKTYAICSISGRLGPKNVKGDSQTPEGFYRIDDFNPRSGYWLSLHLNYPNEADRMRGAKDVELGDNIFIHGGCRTDGCLPITDVAIKELYWLSMETRARGQDIPVHIFPMRMTEAHVAQINRMMSKNPDVLWFWRDLKRGYDYFETTHKLPPIYIDPIGRYRIAPLAFAPTK